MMPSESAPAIAQRDKLRGVAAEWAVRRPAVGAGPNAWLVLSVQTFLSIDRHPAEASLQAEVDVGLRYGILVWLSPEEIHARTKIAAVLGLALMDRAEDWSWIVQADDSSIRRLGPRPWQRNLIPLAALARASGVPVRYRRGSDLSAQRPPHPWVDFATTGPVLATGRDQDAGERVTHTIEYLGGIAPVVRRITDTLEAEEVWASRDQSSVDAKRKVVDARGHQSDCPGIVDILLKQISDAGALVDLLATITVCVGLDPVGMQLAAVYGGLGFEISSEPSSGAQRLTPAQCRCRKNARSDIMGGTTSSRQVGDQLIRRRYPNAHSAHDATQITERLLLAADVADLSGWSPTGTWSVQAISDAIRHVPSDLLHFRVMPSFRKSAQWRHLPERLERIEPALFAGFVIATTSAALQVAYRESALLPLASNWIGDAVDEAISAWLMGYVDQSVACEGGRAYPHGLERRPVPRHLLEDILDAMSERAAVTLAALSEIAPEMPESVRLSSPKGRRTRPT